MKSKKTLLNPGGERGQQPLKEQRSLDIMGIIKLVNTLLIPLLAFLVANREVIFELLGWSI